MLTSFLLPPFNTGMNVYSFNWLGKIPSKKEEFTNSVSGSTSSREHSNQPERTAYYALKNFF